MGMNTVALLHEARIDDWPVEIRNAALGGSGHSSSGRLGDFSYGHILARANKNASVIVSVHGNTGAEIEHAITEARSRKSRHDEAILRQLRDLLYGHGYTVRRPGRSRGEGPISWGFAEEVRTGKQSLPETNPVVAGPGAGVAVILLNDFADRWPDEVRLAMNTLGIDGLDGSFDYGRVLSVAHADFTQVAGISGASGQSLRPDRFVDPSFLDLAAQVLLRNGHAVRAPGAKRYTEPAATEMA